MNQAIQRHSIETAEQVRFRRIKREPSTGLARRLISATVETFAEKGILGARIAEITKAAGTTDPAFYRYFPSLRAAALFILSEYYWLPLNRRFAHYRQVTTDPEQLFDVVVSALIGSAKDDPVTPWLDESKVFQIVVSQMRNPFLLPDSLVDPEYLAFLRNLDVLILGGQEAGCFGIGVRSIVLAHSLVTTLHGLLVDNAVSPGRLKIQESEIRQVARRLVDFRPSRADVPGSK
jgi:AcrR family transcriptional regulator